MVEVNDGDALLTTEAFKTAGIEIEMSVVRDGKEATDFLHRRGSFSDAPRPDLILLDLNLPRLDGRQVFAEVKRGVNPGDRSVQFLGTERHCRSLRVARQLIHC
jgi:CheY-like chemotaxis protein